VPTPMLAGLPPPTPLTRGASAGSVFGDFALGAVSLMIVVACWLYARGSSSEDSFARRHSLRMLRAARAVREAVREALEAVRERI
jgi:hypothetical protein